MHNNARMVPAGRSLMVKFVLAGGSVAEAAAKCSVSERTVWKWVARWREEGEAGMMDRSSRPHHMPTALPRCRYRQIERLRKKRHSSLYIARALELPVSTVVRVQRRLGLNRLSRLEPSIPVIRYERSRPGELIHLDIKKLARIGRIGHRITGTRRWQFLTKGIGWEYLHVAVDDYSRFTYSELLRDERGESSAGFLERAAAWFRSHGIERVEGVMTDNGKTYASNAFKGVLAKLKARHLLTKPYTPRTNGKVERMIQTLLREWAYARPYRNSIARSIALKAYLAFYNTKRPHTALQYGPPASRLPTVNNVLINNI